jgi:hypothetical protein
MKGIPHTPESYTAANRKDPLSQSDRELAAAYCRLFSTDDGRRVLASLTAKFDPRRPRVFEHSDIVKAAKIDGQSDVLREIRAGIAAGSPITGIPTP